MTRKISTIASIVFFSTLSFAWGPTGHRAVAEIAQRHLNLLSSKSINTLLKGSTLAEASTWADEVKYAPEFKEMVPLHFADVLPEFKSFNDAPPNSEGNVVIACQTLFNFLKSGDSKLLKPVPALTKIDRVMALKLLIHLVADIHQPLHIIDSKSKDGKSTQGENKIKVMWMNKEETNLHAVWDFQMIDSEKLSYEELANFSEHATDADREVWTKSTFADWANESLALRDQVFTFPDKQNYPPKAEPGISAPIAISYDYINANRETIRHRLDQAGLRLAYLLNKIF
jgi:hypothetical protein